MSRPSGSADVVVVGAGVLGASIARHAARAGLAVTVVDEGRPGAGVTADSFAWIGSSGVRTGPAADLRRAAIDDHHRLDAELPGYPVTWSGALWWHATDQVPEPGPGQEIVDAATVGALEPRLREPPPWAVWSPGDGSVDPVAVVDRLLRDATDLGATLRSDTPVSGLLTDATGRVVGVDTPAGSVGAGTVVLAAATATAELAATAGVSVPVGAATVVLAATAATAELAATAGVSVPVGPSPSLLVRFDAPGPLVGRIVTTEHFDLRQVAADRLIAATDSASESLAAVRRMFVGAEPVTVHSARYGARPMPVDGEPIVGPANGTPGLYVAVTHAAVTLAPILGRLIADELIGSGPAPLLQGCRPGRFAATGPGRG